MTFTIFGMVITDWLTIVLLLLAGGYFVLFIRFLFGKEIPGYGKYFRMMFKSYETSTLRIGFRILILSIEYILGIIVIAFIQLAYYPAFIIRLLVKKTLISEQRVQDKSNEIKD
jgi:hypothetical protein